MTDAIDRQRAEGFCCNTPCGGDDGDSIADNIVEKLTHAFAGIRADERKKLAADQNLTELANGLECVAYPSRLPRNKPPDESLVEVAELIAANIGAAWLDRMAFDDP